MQSNAMTSLERRILIQCDLFSPLDQRAEHTMCRAIIICADQQMSRSGATIVPSQIVVGRIRVSPTHRKLVGMVTF